MNGAIVLCALAVAGMLVARSRGSPGIAAMLKMVAASTYLWAALAWGALDSAYGIAVLAALSLSWLGDLLLVRSGTSFWFRLGIAAFLLAHLAYAGAFMLLGAHPVATAAATLAMAATGALILRWLYPHLPGNYRLPVVAYVAAIGIMVVLACGAAVATRAPILAGGALAFLLSDLAVARDRFVRGGLVNKLWGQPLYFTAQLLLAWTVTLATR